MLNIQENTDRLFINDKEIILVGTAHVSKESAELVKEVILSEKPDTVCLELCATRLASLRDREKWRNMNIVKVVREKKTLLLLMNLMLASFQKKIAEKFDVLPGQEMINALEAGEEAGAAIIPVDREIQITLSRVWRSMGIWEKIKLMFQLVFSLGSSDDITEEDIEQMKKEDILKVLLADVKKSHPVVEKILIDERDQYLTESLRQVDGKK